MEKHAKPKNINILKYLPKAASAVNFYNPPFSPGRDKRADNLHRLKAHAAGKAFSGPIITMIPYEIRRKPKNKSGLDESQEDQEPTSPKISCMGQIKQKKKKMCKTNRVSHQETKPAVSSPRKAVKKHSTKFKRLFRVVKSHRKSDASSEDGRPPLGDMRAPSVSQMKRFASGRDHGLANFDWTAQIMPTDQRECYSDEERMFSDDEEDEDVKIPFSAPLAVGGDSALRPRKEVNLWKRRTMNPPRRLQLN